MNLYLLKITDTEERHVQTGDGEYEYDTIEVPTFDLQLFTHEKTYTEKEWDTIVDEVKYDEGKRLKTEFLIIEELRQRGFHKIPVSLL